MTPELASHCIAFEGARRIASGPLAEVVAQAKKVLDRKRHAPVLVFDLPSSAVVEVDFRGSLDDVLARLPAAPPAEPEATVDAPEDAPRGRGRPRLGVVAREVTLLPRHWDWLGTQPGGASVALRKLVEEARRTHAGRDAARRARDAAYRFMSVMGTNQDSAEEASRALFAGDAARFSSLLADWPADVRTHTLALAEPSFQAPAGDQA